MEINVAEAIVPTRNLNLLYIILDCVFLAVFCGLLLWKKRYATVLFALFGGALYTVVDFGGFYLLSHTRTVFINGELQGAGMTFLVLLWMSMSYGFTNFAFIWTLVSRDGYAKYWVFLIVMWWMTCPSISELGGAATITTSRTTGAYHGWMGVALAIGYIGLTVLLLRRDPKAAFVSILRLCAIGIAVQFGWEFSLLVNGIRPMNGASIRTLIVNSCLETNLGMPYIYGIWYWWNKRFREDLSRRVPKEAEGEEAQLAEAALSEAPEEPECGVHE